MQGIEDGEDGFSRRRGEVVVGGRWIIEDGGDFVEAAEASLDVEDLVGRELHVGLL